MYTIIIKVIFFLFICLSVYADPWGKDADLVKSNRIIELERPPNKINTPVLGPIGEILIGFHQNVISPADGPRSHFIPSSSQYTLDAMRKYGFFKGFILGCDRLMRENDEEWVYPKIIDSNGQLMKWDPIP